MTNLIRLGLLLWVCALANGCVDQAVPTTEAERYTNWSSYLGDEGRRHYSSLSQVDSSNLEQLEVAWTYHSGDASAKTRVQCNPLYADGSIFVVTAGLSLACLDASTGTEQWRFSPFQSSVANQWRGQSRGMHLWRNPAGVLKVVWAVSDKVFMLDAVSGQPSSGFGESCVLSLREDLDDPTAANQLVVTTPGAIFKDFLILGFMTTEKKPAMRGCIRAYDLNSGDLAWRFNTIPDADDPAAKSWEDSAQLDEGAGANNWCGMALDIERGTVFIPTGTSTDDFYGGGRLGENLYANCLIALDAATGKLRWYQQLVHHDIWDYDLPSPPTLVEVVREGKRIEAVAQPTKMGFVYVFDRDTGESLFDITEQTVPTSNIPGEKTAPTQPYSSLPPFVRQSLQRDDLNPRAENLHELQARFEQLNKGLFTPPSFDGSLMSPGYDGGANWGGAATAPESGLLVLNAIERPSVVTLNTIESIIDPGEQAYVQYCAGCHGTDRKGGTFHGSIPSVLKLDDRYSLASLQTMIAAGKGAMPAFAHLDERELEAISSYLLELPIASRARLAAEAQTGKFGQKVKTNYVHTGYEWFVDREGYPAVKPPWGTITAYDLNRGEIAWQRPLGLDSLWASRGDSTTGTINYGGPLITATGLVFIGATTDATFRALSLKTGQILWQTKLPYDGVATPSTYLHEGHQYLLIAAGGGKHSTRRGDAYVAWRLKE